MDQAIVTRLGPLRAVSFRGVTAFGSDIYMAHFANGTAEWRISLVKDGMIGRIALGPQYESASPRSEVGSSPQASTDPDLQRKAL